MNMEMKKSEICDRWTILRMKARLSEESKTELKEYEEAFLDLFYEAESNVFLMFEVMNLMESNARIWENEAAIRKEYAKDPSAGEQLDHAEIGRRAIIIRDFNKLRVNAKQAIDKMFGQIPDKKIDHVSQ